jgi:hypothetical protein
MASSAKMNTTMAKVAEREARSKAKGQAKPDNGNGKLAARPKPKPKPEPAPEVNPLIAKAEAAAEEWGGKVPPPRTVTSAADMDYLVETFSFAKGGILIQTGAEVVKGLTRALTVAARVGKALGVASVNPWHDDPSLPTLGGAGAEE